MSEREFENYLALLAKLLRLGGKQRAAIASELRTHLEDRMEELLARGVPREEAIRQALEEFGDAAGLAADFVSLSQNRRRRWLMRLTTYSVAVTLLVAAGLFTFWPGRNAGPGVAMLVAQTAVDPAGAPKAVEAVAPKAVDPFAVPKPAKTDRSEQSPSDAAQRLRFELEKPTHLEFVEQPLKDVVLFLAEQHNIPIYLRAKRLEEAGISPDHPITLNFKGVRLRTALEIMLSDLELTYVEKDGLLMITTPEEAQNTLVIQVYNCRDLLADDLGKAAAKNADPLRNGVGGEGGGAAPGGFGGGGFGGAMPGEMASDSANQELCVRQLMNLLSTNVDQQSWLQSGGPGTISEFSGLIVVTQSAETHRKVERTLDMLREAAGLEIMKAGKVVR